MVVVPAAAPPDDEGLLRAGEGGAQAVGRENRARRLGVVVVPAAAPLDAEGLLHAGEEGWGGGGAQDDGRGIGRRGARVKKKKDKAVSSTTHKGEGRLLGRIASADGLPRACEGQERGGNACYLLPQLKDHVNAWVKTAHATHLR